MWHLEAGSVVTILQVVLNCKLSWWATCVYTWNFGKSHLKRVSNCNISNCPVSIVLFAVFNNIFSILCAKGENADRAADTFLQCVSGAWLVFKYVSCTHELWLVVELWTVPSALSSTPWNASWPKSSVGIKGATVNFVNTVNWARVNCSKVTAGWQKSADLLW